MRTQEGGTPKARWKLAVRWLWLEKPTARAITARSSSPAAEPLERGAQAQVRAVLVQRVAGLAPERAREVERRDVDGAAELLEREVLGEARAQQRLGVLDHRPAGGAGGAAGARRPRRRRSPWRARAAAAAPPRPGRRRPRASARAIARAVRYGRGSSLPIWSGKRASRSHSSIVSSPTTMKWLRSPWPLKRRRRKTSPGLKNIAWLGPASAGSRPWTPIHTGVAGKHDVRDLADEVVERPAHVVRRAPERAERDHRAQVQRRDADPIPLTGVPGGEAQRSWRGFGQDGHRRDRKPAPAATGTRRTHRRVSRLRLGDRGRDEQLFGGPVLERLVVAGDQLGGAHEVGGGGAHLAADEHEVGAAPRGSRRRRRRPGRPAGGRARRATARRRRRPAPRRSSRGRARRRAGPRAPPRRRARG